MSGAGELHLAFLGCGQAARTHARTLRKLDRDVRLHFASRSRERAEAFAERHGGVAHEGYGGAMEDPRVDAVVVTTPPDRHLELARAALEAGKHAVVEKPPFLRARDVDEVERLAARADRRVLVAENYHYKPVAVLLRRWLEEGVVGRPLFLLVNALKRQAVEGWRDRQELAGGGALFEGGIHWVNLVAGLGPEVREVRALRAGPEDGLERSMLVAFRFADGAVASLHHSWEVDSPLRGLRISHVYGTAGSLAFESNGVFALAWGRRKRLTLPGFRDIAGYRAMFADFLRVLRDGTEPSMTLAMARRDLALVEAAYRSARSGRPERLRELEGGGAP